MNKARKEIENAIRQTPDLCIAEFVPEILAIVDKFGESGQSGFSAPYYAHAISYAVKKLCLHQPISDLTGNNDEWICHYFDNNFYWQSNRNSAVFMGVDKRPYYLDAIVFREENDCCFTGNSVRKQNGEIITSRQFFKMPCTPKTFYVDVVEIDGNSIVKDESQLDAVFDFYELPLSVRFMMYLQTGK